MAELEVFEETPEGAEKANQAAGRIIEEYGEDAGSLYMETARSVERFLQLKQATETLREMSEK